MSSWLIKLFLHLSALLPLPLLHAVAYILGQLLYWLPNDLRRVTRINLQLCFGEWSASQQRRLARLSLIEAAKSALEMGPMWYWSRRRCQAAVRRVHGEALLAEAVGEGHGVILAAPHIGMWELIGLYGSDHYPMTSMFRPPRLPGLGDVMSRGRERFGARLVPTDASGIRALYKALARGELVAVLPDQEPRWGNGVFAPFFGIPAYTMTLLPRMAHKSQARVLLAWAERLPWGRGYDLHFEVLPETCRQGDMAQAAHCLNTAIEACIRKQPAQYQWSYRRFRTGPDNRPYAYYWRGRR